MSILLRAAAGGLAFGIAAGLVEAWLSLAPLLSRGFGPGPGFLARVAGLELLLGTVLGVLAAPVLLLRGGRWLHPLVLVALWCGLAAWVSLDSPLFTAVQYVPPALAGGLVLVGLWMAGRRPLLPWAIGGALLIGGVLAPPIALAWTRPPIEQRAELPPPPDDAPDVVLVVLDTVRAGSLTSWGYARDTAPGIAALAREGALFLDATSPSTWSLPSHASLFTGRYPSSHAAHAEHRYLDDRYPTLAQVLEGNGYETFCFTANAWISDGLGLTRGFAHQDRPRGGHGGAGLGFSFIHRLLDRLGLQETDKGGGLVVGSFESWARERPADAERPAFVFLNFIEAHFPYHQLPHEHLFRFTDRGYGELRQISVDLLGAQFGGPGRDAAEVREPTVDMYDGGIVYTDELLGRVVGALRDRGTLDDTVLVVLADHGEVLGERGGYFGHGPSLYQESVGVPLLVRYPAKVPAGARVEEPVSTLGVFATILDLAGLPEPPTLQVGSLATLLRGDASPGPILAELHDASAMTGARSWDDPQMQSGRRWRLLRHGDLKLVTSSEGEALLYDLAADPSESRDLSAERPQDAARMRAELDRVLAALDLPALDAPLALGAEAPALDDATRDQLRALGYSE
ncbi:MAG: sulfatase family protein [Myxococcota bacterium]